jgi:hypothetical protein
MSEEELQFGFDWCIGSEYRQSFKVLFYVVFDNGQ